MSTKRNIQCFREWGYSNNFLKIQSTAETMFIDPTLNSKERNRLKWQSRRPKEI